MPVVPVGLVRRGRSYGARLALTGTPRLGVGRLGWPSRSGAYGEPIDHRYHEGVRRYFTPRCIALHLTLLVVLPAFALLTRWQLDRALGGNTLSWAYTFEWPLFAGYAVYVWWSLVHDTANAMIPGHRGQSPDGRRSSGGPSADGSADGALAVGGRSKPQYLEPGWALTGGRERNVAIATATAVDPARAARGERFTEQTHEEAEQLAAYNRYLNELAQADEEADADGAEAQRR
jgi:hypothetical protein